MEDELSSFKQRILYLLFEDQSTKTKLKNIFDMLNECEDRYLEKVIYKDEDDRVTIDYNVETGE